MTARTTAQIADAVLKSIPSLSSSDDVQMKDASDSKGAAKQAKRDLKSLLIAFDKLEADLNDRAEKLIADELPSKIMSLHSASTELFGPSLVSLTRSPLKEAKSLSGAPVTTPTKSAPLPLPLAAIGTRSPAASSSSSSLTGSGHGALSPAVARAFSVAPSAAVQSVLPRMKAELRDMSVSLLFVRTITIPVRALQGGCDEKSQACGAAEYSGSWR